MSTPKRDIHPITRRVRNTVLVTTGVLGLGAFGSLADVEQTRAAWTDLTSMVSGTVASHTMRSIPAGSIGCTPPSGGGESVTLSWTDLDPRYEYDVVAKDSDGGTYFSTSVRGSGGTVSVVVPKRNASVWLITYTHPVTVTPKLAGTTWKGSATTRNIYERGNIIGTNRVYCAQP